MAEPKRRRGHDFDSIKTTNIEERAKITDQVELFKFPADTWVILRIVSPVFLYSGYWIKTKKKDGKPGKFYMPSPSFDPESQEYDSTLYDPFYLYGQEEASAKVDREQRLVQISKYGYCNAIIRKLQANKPARLARPMQEEIDSGYKQMDSDTWTPIRVLRLSTTLMDQIKSITETNTVTIKGETRAISVGHPKGGMDLRIRHSPEKAPAMQYQVLPIKRTPLSEAEVKYFKWNLDSLEEPDNEAEVRKSYTRWAEAMGIKERRADGDDGFEEGDDGLEDDDDQPRRPSGKKPQGKKPAGKRPPADEYEEDLEEGDGGDWGDDGFEEDEPPKRRPAGKKPAPGKRRPPEDDDGFDEGDDEDPPFDTDEDDGFEEDGFEEEEEKPRRPAGKKPAGKPQGKRRPEPEPEEEESEDEGWGDDGDEGWGDEEEEAEPEPPKRRPAGKKPAAKPQGKRRPAPAEDSWGDDDDIPY